MVAGIAISKFLSGYSSKTTGVSSEESKGKKEEKKGVKEAGDKKTVRFANISDSHDESEDDKNSSLPSNIEEMIKRAVAEGIKNSSIEDITLDGLMKRASSDQSLPSMKKKDPIQRRRYSESDNPIYKICFTGGPCAGKTTAMTSLQSLLQSLGFQVFLVPEAATTLMKAGFTIDNTSFTELTCIQFQSCLMRYQIFIEDLNFEYASATTNKP